MASIIEAPHLSPRLLERISAERPAGDFLYYDPLYDQIRHARRTEPDLPQGVWKRSIKTADWELVERLCLTALETRTKDLNIAAWLTEAWIQLHGLPGLESGIRLVHGLCEEFWDELYPALEPDEPERRYAPLVWLDDKLPAALGQVEVTRPVTQDDPWYTWSDRAAALVLQRRGQKEPALLKQAAESGAVTVARFDGSVALTPPPFYLELTAQIDAAAERLAELDRLLDERCQGPEAPSLSAITRTLNAMGRWARQTAEEKGALAPPPEPVPESAAAPLAVAVPAVPAVHITGTSTPERTLIENRDEAYRALAEAAEFLARSEPHSPTPYLIKRAVAWGQKPLTELLEEFAKDGNNLQALYGLLGLKETK